MSNLLIRGGRVVCPASGFDSEPADVLILGGAIVAAGPGAGASAPPDIQVLDASGLVVCPGFIDLHVHLREPGREDKETIATGTRAAAAGGFTSIFCIPNTDPVLDSATGLHYVLSRAAAAGMVNVFPYASVTKGQLGEEIVEFGDLVASGARGFTDDGRPVMNSETMRRALEYSAMFGVPVLDHCEDAPMAHGGVMHEGAVSLRLGLKGIPAIAESVQVARDVELAAATGGHIHIMHVSKKESLGPIRAGKARGVKVTAEVTPHHLCLTDELLAEFDTLAKVNPPLGGADDRAALREALLDGTIDCISTDHAPHTDIEKDFPINDAPFGMVGLETAFPLLNTELVRTGAVPSLTWLIERMTAAPARVIGLAPRGSLAAGAPGDVTVLDPDAEVTVTRDFLKGKSRNTPLMGRKLHGAIRATVVSGRVVWENR